MADINEEIERELEREELRLTSVRKRALASVIDELFISLLLLAVLWDSFAASKTLEDTIGITNAFVLEFMAMKIIYQTFFLYQYGATLGKIIMKIQVVELKTLSTPSLVCAFNRSVFRIVSEMIFYLGFLWGMLDPLRQTWHDKTARTVVVDA
jgi:uncharacterized RDD family membrane protein YckC